MFLLISSLIHYFQIHVLYDFHSFIFFKVCCGYQRGKVGGGLNWEIGIDIYTLLYIK